MTAENVLLKSLPNAWSHGRAILQNTSQWFVIYNVAIMNINCKMITVMLGGGGR